MKWNCAIFDFDGTLFDSMYLWDTAAENYLMLQGKAARPDIREKVRKLSLFEAAEYMKEAYCLAGTAEEITCGVNQVIEHSYRDEVLPKTGVIPFLQEMRRREMQICIATATDRRLIEAALYRCGMEEFFDAIFTCGEVGHGKNEPEIYRCAMEHFGAQRGNTIIFEDAVHAVRTAKQDGFTVAAVFDESEKNPDAVMALADFYFESFEREVCMRFWKWEADKVTEGSCSPIFQEPHPACVNGNGRKGEER